MNSKTTVLAVIIFLGLVGLATVAGGFVLAYQGTTIPGELIAVGSLAIGALAGILSKTNTEPAIVDAVGNPAIAVAGAPPAPAPPGPDLAAARTKLGELLEVLNAPLEAVLADETADH